MQVLAKILTGGVAAAALVGAAPATAQYYPGGPGYGYGGDPLGQAINQVFGGGYGYGVDRQAVVNQCAAAVQQRLNGGYGEYRYGGYDGYGGYNGYAGYGFAGGRVLGISRVEPRSNGGLTVRGVATTGRHVAYGYGGGAQPRADLTWRCRADYRGFITDIDVDPAQPANGYGPNYNYAPQPYTPYNNDYSQYGYRRY